jgi:predicted nucleotidyltransferase component of viral defense system
MLPQAALNAWAQQAPWAGDLDVEQDLILSRAIVDIANHPLLGEELAFRGGTSLHKLHIEQPWRYSNDLDYVRTTNGPIKEIMAGVRETMHVIGLEEAKYEVKEDIVNMKFDAEPTRGLGGLRVKVEINTRETEPCFELIALPYAVNNVWFSGHADVATFSLEELLGTKLRALYQRRKGRDLFDLWLGLEHLAADPVAVIDAYQYYLARSGLVIDPAEFEHNLDAKLAHEGFRRDLDQLLREPPAGYTPEAGVTAVRDRILARLR